MKTENLVSFSIPTYLIPNLPKQGDNAFATVVSHTKTGIALQIGDVEVAVKIKNPKSLYKKGAKLFFNDDGAVVGGELDGGGDISAPILEEKPVTQSTTRSGSSMRVNARLP